ncbi:unnamed protein product, partial [Durusdinium trenchii]
VGLKVAQNFQSFVPADVNGSFGHPWACKRKCARFAAGHCAFGDRCGYCHLTHTGGSTLDKRQRSMMSALTEAQQVDLLKWSLQERASTQGAFFQQVVDEFITVVEQHFRLAGDWSSGHHHQAWRSMEKALRKLDFSAPLCMLVSKSQYSPELLAAEERLRGQLHLLDEE